jgi:hypothetical protein
MWKGLGRIQRGCLRVIEEYEAAGKRPTTVNIAAAVYRVGPHRLSETQHVTTERALATLRQKGLVSGQHDMTVYSVGTKGFPRTQGLADGSYRADAASGHALAARTWRRLARWRQIERHPHFKHEAVPGCGSFEVKIPGKFLLG